VIGANNMIWGLDYPHNESDVSPITEHPGGVPEDEQAEIAAGNIARLYNFAWQGRPSLL
jgi:predicted TIM-barrel fold metal-dependent hydrolase